MKKYIAGYILCTLLAPCVGAGQISSSAKSDLKVILIRHAEKPDKGDNLTCKGLNRALHLPAVIQSKFGIPDFVYVPALKTGGRTAHSRMFETAMPLAVKYNLTVNTGLDEKDVYGLAGEIKGEHGTVLVVWEHSVIGGIVHALGINGNMVWPPDDYDSIWIVSFVNGKATLTTDHEGLDLSDNCP